MAASIATASRATPVGTGTSLTPTAKDSAVEQQDRFMKLLVAQLKNQDPLNPQDNAQTTSQMAQISTVNGINQLNESVKSLIGQFSSLQGLQGANLIGRDVVVKSDTLSVDAGKAKGAVDLSGDADKVSVQILSPGGQVLDTLNLGPLTAGRHAFEWDATNYKATANPVFKVSASNGKQGVAATALAQDTVTALQTSGSTLSLQLKGRAAIAYEAVQAIL